MVSPSATKVEFPRSPSLPLLDPRASLSHFAADYAASSATCIAAESPSFAHVFWSAAEAVLGLPRIELPGEKGGEGIYVERTLLDAFLPFNATLSLVRHRTTREKKEKHTLPRSERARRLPCAGRLWPS